MFSVTSRSLPTSCSSYSQPTTPTMLPPLPGEVREPLVQKVSPTNIQVTLDSITVQWEPPQRLPEEATEILYTLAYASEAEDGNLGDFIEVANLKDTTTVIDGLTMDTLYTFKAKVRYRRLSMNESMWLQVLTNEGASEFSNMLTIKTMSDQTDLGKFEDQVMGKLTFLISLK